VPYKDFSRQRLAVETWAKNHREQVLFAKRKWIHKARVEGRVPYNEFFSFKGNPKLAQRLSKSLFFAEGQEEVRSNLELQGIKLQVSNKPVLEQDHVCTEPCSFFGHVEAWVNIEPVAYKIHFHGDFPNKHGGTYWLFRRYRTRTRNLDFPAVRPVFKCSKCNFQTEFERLEDMFVFQHTCPLPIDPMDEALELAIIRNNSCTFVDGSWSLRKLHRWIGSNLSTTGFGFSISARRLGFVASKDESENVGMLP